MSVWFRGRLLLDRALAAALLLVFSPVIAVCMVLVRRHDGGPALISVPRLGRHGLEFRMWKVRSMRAEAPDGMATGLALTGEHDPRMTPIGIKLRAYYLDELPQLYNVVRGEMCLLGPRPEAPEFVDSDDPLWREVLAAPPGIAGPTQLIVNDWERHRITEDPTGHAYVHEVLPVKLAIDAWYLRRSSLRVDALVASTLLRRILPGSEAYTLKKLVHTEVPQSDRVPA